MGERARSLAAVPRITTFETSPRLLSSCLSSLPRVVRMWERRFGECSLRLDAEHIVADFHESEHIDLGRNGCILRLCEVEFGVGKGRKR